MLQSDHLTDVDRVLLVDDWIETGSQALAARTLIDGTGAELAGLAVIVRDGTTREVQERLQPIHSSSTSKPSAPPMRYRRSCD